MSDSDSSFQELKEQVGEIHRAIVGDALGNKGIAQRLDTVERKQAGLDAKLSWALGFFAALLIVWEAVKNKVIG